MASLKRTPTLEDLWRVNHLRCCSCGEDIYPGTHGQAGTLVRTFSLATPNDPGPAACSSRLVSPTGRSIWLHDRHLECAQGVKYVTISHVWNPTVSKVQNRQGTPAEAAEALRLVYELPTSIYDAIPGSADDGVEVWHDYLSVPQWQGDVKEKILLGIADIFRRAACTVVYLGDVGAREVELMRRGKSAAEVMQGVSRICNAVWFSRVWTAMEFARSRSISVVLADYRVAEGVHDVFVGEVSSRFYGLVEKVGNIHAVEDLAPSLLPWQLGPLGAVGKGGVMFAKGLSLLAKRSCRSDEDFFYALRSIIAADVPENLDYTDFAKASSVIAKACLVQGDYSPLLMSPLPFSGKGRMSQGYEDVLRWGLGPQQRKALFEDGLTLSPTGQPVLKAENIGLLHSVKMFNRAEPNLMRYFSRAVGLVLEFTGPDLDAFTSTLGTRLYGQDSAAMKERLSQHDRRAHLQSLLIRRYNLQDWYDERERGGEDHWMAEALGLSTRELPHTMAGEHVSPIAFMGAHGMTIHLMNERSALLGITCTSCCATHLFRAALYVAPAEARGAVAYRIPGLRYAYTLEDGIAIIVKEGRIVGRMIWAVPACSCRRVEAVEVQLADIPKRVVYQHMPNPIE